MGSITDKIKGVGNEVAGKVKQAIGEGADDSSMKVKGAAQESKGEAQQAVGKAKDTVKKGIDRL